MGRLPTHLREFDGSYTLLSGGFINANFDGLNQLEYLVLDGNFLDSSVPTALNQLAKLQYLYIADSGITGDLTYLQQGMPSLREHWIDFNPALRGPIPTQVGDMQSLQSLSMTRNGLWGTVPSELGSLTSLKHLWLSGNLFGGLIPTQLSQLQQLQTLQLEGNRFYASMPDEICTLADRFGSSLSVMGVDCSEVSCPCCTCCSYEECNPDLV